MRTVLISALLAMAGSVCAQQNALDRYISEGLEKNIVLQQKSVSLEKALTAIQTAKSMYLPSVSFQGAYQTADGGRNIPLPIGDLLNGVYSTLNQLTNSQRFPKIENQTINFLPRNFYDVKVRTVVPIINTDIGYSKKISEQQAQLKEYEIDTYRRELIGNIKSAYFNYLTALQSVSIYRSALELAEEGKRVNEKLLENGKGLPAYVLRATSEIETIRAQVSAAEQQAANARLYFNSLLNRSAEEPIDTSFDINPALAQANAAMLSESDIRNREELRSLSKAVELNETAIKMNRSFNIPKLNGFLDLGSQSEDFHFNDKSRYYMAGLQLEIPIFAGNRNKQKIRQAELDLRFAELSRVHYTQQIKLAADVALNNLRSAWQTYNSTLKQLEAAESYQRLIEKGYRAGTHTYIETVDARNQLTMARLSVVINTYRVLQAAATLERETAAAVIGSTSNSPTK